MGPIHLPKMLVMLGLFFVLLVEPPTVSGLQCLHCGMLLNGRPTTTHPPDNETHTTPGVPMLGGRHCEGPLDGDKEGCTASLSGKEGWTKSSEYACLKRTINGKLTKTCVIKKPAMEMKCKNDDTTGDGGPVAENCYCDDQDFCNGGPPTLEIAFGLMSITALISIYKGF